MRRALGLTNDNAGRSASQPEQQRAGSQGRLAGRPSADKPRHRFVQDGAVPVIPYVFSRLVRIAFSYGCFGGQPVGQKARRQAKHIRCKTGLAF